MRTSLKSRLALVRGLLPALACGLVMATGAAAPGQDGSGSSATPAGSVEVGVESFGLGNVARPGSWVGIRLALTDHGGRVRDVLVRMERADSDGDIESIRQRVALAPGATRGLWMYARLPFYGVDGVVYNVLVDEVVSEDNGEIVTSGDPIGSGRLGAAGLFRPDISMVGVIGRRSMGLEEYAVEFQPGQDVSGTMHNLMRTISGLRPVDLPDSWMGLDQYEAIVWADGDPASLMPSQVHAIEDWVRAGGRLIIVMGAAAPDWMNPRANPLHAILPRTLVQRQDNADLEPSRKLLTIEDERPMPTGETLHVFRPDREAPDTVALLRDARGRTVAVRRTVGCGEVTLIGIDLGSIGLAGIIDAEAIWHRVLGRRGDLFSQSEMDELRRSDDGANFFHPEGVWLDDVITGRINKIGRAGVGVLLGLVVFGVYLLLAGPVSFAALGKMGRRQHSWVVFLAMAGIFTGIAWGGATALRPAKVDISHLTLLEHVYEQPTQRAKVWFSVLLPTYGAQTVAVPTESGSGRDEFAALSNWDDPESFSSGNFPDSRRYAVDSRRPESLRVPTRSTVKRFEAQWVGGPRWRMIRPDENNPIRVNPDGSLRGTLTHELPAGLDRVTVMYVRGQTPITARRLGGPLLADALAHRLTERWAPGQPLDLAQLGAPSRAERFFETLVAKERVNQFTGVGATATPADRMDMLLWRDALEPPSWRESNTGQTYDRTLRTRSAHGWGAGRWITQPCLMITGHLEGVASPVPIEIDGDAPPTTGTTVVRWVYPLPANPPVFLDTSADEGETDPEETD